MRSAFIGSLQVRCRLARIAHAMSAHSMLQMLRYDDVFFFSGVCFAHGSLASFSRFQTASACLRARHVSSHALGTMLGCWQLRQLTVKFRHETTQVRVKRLKRFTKEIWLDFGFPRKQLDFGFQIFGFVLSEANGSSLSTRLRDDMERKVVEKQKSPQSAEDKEHPLCPYGQWVNINRFYARAWSPGNVLENGLIFKAPRCVAEDREHWEGWRNLSGQTGCVVLSCLCFRSQRQTKSMKNMKINTANWFWTCQHFASRCSNHKCTSAVLEDIDCPLPAVLPQGFAPELGQSCFESPLIASFREDESPAMHKGIGWDKSSQNSLSGWIKLYFTPCRHLSCLRRLKMFFLKKSIEIMQSTIMHKIQWSPMKTPLWKTSPWHRCVRN